MNRTLGCTENNYRRWIVHSCEHCCGVCATGIWAEINESYLESVLVTWSDQSQHLKQISGWIQMHPATVLLCVKDEHCAVQLKFCPSLAVPAPLPLPGTWCWPQYCASQTLESHAVMLTGLLSPWTILFVWRYNISRTFIHKKYFTVCRNFCSTRKLQEWACSCSTRE